MKTFDQPLAAELADKIRALYDLHVDPTINCATTDTQVLVEPQPDDSLWIIFPGTASLRDWLTDCRFLRKPWYDCGSVHAGFVDAFESIKADLVKSLPGDNTPIVIAGHSLGGALATLAAEYLHDCGEPLAAVYTFGQPRTGNGVFARAYDEDLHDLTWRIVNALDPVPWSLLAINGYRHSGQPVYLRADNTIMFGGGFRRLLDNHILGRPRLENHHITEYISKLRDREVVS